ncbi:DUF1801 domain-containing protein [Thalassotalea insulae]|nr:DUF1801 domain-containing protein [Thalassotalea insulae]
MKTEMQVKLESYPHAIKPLILELRQLIFTVANELQLGEIDETIKWGELSYQVQNGSPVRIDWKAKTQEHYYLFFHCQTKLIDTFRELYSDSLTFQANRAIVLNIDEKLPEKAVRHCLELAMQYKKLKHLPLLGA